MSNVGTWMQRVAQDWLVLQLTGFSGAAIGITTGLQFLPFLLLSPFAGLVADRIPKRRLLQMTNLGMAVPALILGLLAVTGTAQIWHVYVLAFVLGTAAAFDAPARQSFVSEIVDKDDLTNAVGLNSASFNAARIVGPAARRRPDRRPRRRCGRHRLGDPGQRDQLRRADHDPAQPRRVRPALAEADGPRAGPDPGRRRLRPRPSRPAAHPRHRLLHRHLRPQLPDHLGADGDPGVRQGRHRVRPARHVHGRRLADRLAGRRQPEARPAPAGDRRRARLRGRSRSRPG